MPSSVLIGNPDNRVFAERMIVVNGAGVQQTNIMSSASQIYVNDRDAATRVVLFDLTTGLPIPSTSLGGITVPSVTTIGGVVSWDTATGTALRDNPGIIVGTGGALQTAGIGNGAVVGNARGLGAVDLQTNRTLITHVASGPHSFAVGQNNTASGSNGVALGNNNVASGIQSTALGNSNNSGGPSSFSVGTSNNASGTNSVAMGNGCQSTGSGTVAIGVLSTASASTGGSTAIGNTVVASNANSFITGLQASTIRTNESVWSSGNFTGSGSTREAVRSELIIRGTTTDATVTDLVAPTRIILPNDTSIHFEISVTARRTDADNESAMYHFRGGIDRNATPGSTALVGTVVKTVVGEDTAAWDCNVTADTTNGGINVAVTGEAAKTIRWIAHYIGVEVTG